MVESNKVFTQMDFELLQWLSRIVANELQKEPIRSGQLAGEFEHFLVGMLEEKIIKAETIKNRETN